MAKLSWRIPLFGPLCGLLGYC